jgi:hypothetical protein
MFNVLSWFSRNLARFPKAVVNAGGVAAIALFLVILTPNIAAAHGPECSGASCRGLDPVATGCSRDAVTLATIPHPGTASAGFLEVTELRGSARCHARWARVTSRLSASAIKWSSAWMAGHWLATHKARFGAAGTIVWSRMWSGPVGACGVSVAKSDPSYIVPACAP